MNHTFGVCAVLPHLALYLLVAGTSGETQVLPGMVSLWGGLGWSQCVRCFRVAAVDQLSVAHTVVCSLSFSSLMTPKMQSVKGIAGIITLLCFPCAYSAYVLVLFLLLWDSALSCSLCMVFPKWGCLSIESLLTYYQHSVSVLECTPQPRNDLWIGTSLMH